jgi:hypothetical protein
MLAEDLKSWVAVGALIVTVVLGLAIVVASIRTAWIKKIIAGMTVTYAIVGLLFLSSPKWQGLVVEAWGFKAEMARLSQELDQRTAEVKTYQHQIADLQKLNDTKFASAADLLKAIAQTKERVSWAGFLPTNPDRFKVAVLPTDVEAMANLAKQLGVSQTVVANALQASSYELLKPVDAGYLSKAQASDLWLNTSTSGMIQ